MWTGFDSSHASSPSRQQGASRGHAWLVGGMTISRQFLAVDDTLATGNLVHLVS